MNCRSRTETACNMQRVSEDVKIIRDLNGRSKGYGFVDLERSSEGEVQTAHLLSQVRYLTERYLNLGCRLIL